MNPTIKIGSTGEAVRKWQALIGAGVDGSFGPETQRLTKDFQRNKGLVADGIVGPVTWATALGTKIDTNVKTPQAGADASAYNIAKNAGPTLTEKERQYVLSVARGEGFYGKGWGNPNQYTKDLSAKYGLTGLEGVGSNNWGAVQGSGSAGSFQHVDHHADGTPYVNPYKRYAAPEEGFLDMARIILNGGKRGAVGKAEIKAAIDKGSLRDAVFAQHRNGYFELKPEKYLEGVIRNYGIISTNVGWDKMLSEAGGIIKVASNIGKVIVAALVGIGGLWWFTKRS